MWNLEDEFKCNHLNQIKDFICSFLAKAAECRTKSEGINPESYNKSVRDLYQMAIAERIEVFGIFEKVRTAYSR